MLRIVLTLVITFLYCRVWEWLEVIFEGKKKNTMVDNIIMVLFIPMIYLATGVIIYKITAIF